MIKLLDHGHDGAYSGVGNSGVANGIGHGLTLVINFFDGANRFTGAGR